MMILAVEVEQTQQLDLNHIRELFWNIFCQPQPVATIVTRSV